jgi:hypothetical protein
VLDVKSKNIVWSLIKQIKVSIGRAEAYLRSGWNNHKASSTPYVSSTTSFITGENGGSLFLS